MERVGSRPEQERATWKGLAPPPHTTEKGISRGAGEGGGRQRTCRGVPDSRDDPATTVVCQWGDPQNRNREAVIKSMGKTVRKWEIGPHKGDYAGN
ncbi:hypothetical protein NDU88_003603 [Pleurodeles waltl]|uniref:Uncharacterized protein n=1 Tax=Pleurodeles waltl TaxID=8319 RepID=A0AAV7RHX3_PLEWA|nr:hypothetical protein NDU88_003603 [Pleurodeles waltl]